ncbi:hypothetical protein niasHT_032389 [Heterodera trifolii]|uniref:Uncharacterized protein n=1 Tax=Heterodera trifolii TaxID=157864 RepID=A0ABD2HST2_9BILA
MAKIAEQFLLRNVVVETTAVLRRRRDVRQQRNAVQRNRRRGTVLGSDVYAQRKISSSRGNGRVGKQYTDQQTVLAVHRQQMNTVTFAEIGANYFTIELKTRKNQVKK